MTFLSTEMSGIVSAGKPLFMSQARFEKEIASAVTKFEAGAIGDSPLKAEIGRVRASDIEVERLSSILSKCRVVVVDIIATAIDADELRP
jgi:hypothetical protein